MSFAVLYSHSSLLCHICIALTSCYYVLFHSFPSPSYLLSLNKELQHFLPQLWSITLQLIDLLKKTAIRPEILFLSCGAELIGALCPECAKQYNLRFHLCCDICFFAPVIMSLPAFLPPSLSSPLSENKAKY